MLSVKAGIHINRLDMEENHESEEVDIEALIRKIESQQGRLQVKEARRVLGAPSGLDVPTCKPARKHRPVCLHRLTEYKNKQGDVSSVLAVDDLKGMQLDAGKVVEARAKEVGCIRDKRVYTKILRSQAARNS